MARFRISTSKCARWSRLSTDSLPDAKDIHVHVSTPSGFQRVSKSSFGHAFADLALVVVSDL